MTSDLPSRSTVFVGVALVVKLVLTEDFTIVRADLSILGKKPASRLTF
jgi:hypothetical protein